MHDGAEAVGDDEGGAALHQVAQGILDQMFALGVQRTGGFVEDQDFGIGEDGAGDGDALLLAAGEFVAAFADDGFVAFVELQDEVVGIGFLGGCLDFRAGGVAFSVGDVVGDGAVEEIDILQDHGELGAVEFQGELADVGVVEADGAAGDVEETGDEIDEGGFSGARGANDGEGGAGANVQRDAIDDAFFGFVAEVDVVEGDVSGDIFKRLGVGREISGMSAGCSRTSTTRSRAPKFCWRLWKESIIWETGAMSWRRRVWYIINVPMVVWWPSTRRPPYQTMTTPMAGAKVFQPVLRRRPRTAVYCCLRIMVSWPALNSFHSERSRRKERTTRMPPYISVRRPERVERSS